MAQPGVGVADRFEHTGSTVTILNIGGMNDKSDQKTNRVGDDVALAALDLFACIIAANPATFRCFNALAVNYTGTWGGFTTLGLAPPLQAHD